MALKDRLFQEFETLERENQIDFFDPYVIANKVGCQIRQVESFFKLKYKADILSYRHKRQKKQTNSNVEKVLKHFTPAVKNKFLELAIRYCQSGDYQWLKLMNQLYDKTVQ